VFGAQKAVHATSEQSGAHILFTADAGWQQAAATQSKSVVQLLQQTRVPQVTLSQSPQPNPPS